MVVMLANQIRHAVMITRVVIIITIYTFLLFHRLTIIKNVTKIGYSGYAVYQISSRYYHNKSNNIIITI